MAHARRRAHDDQIAGLQGHAFREQHNGFCHTPDHVAGVGVLHDLAIQTGLNPQVGGAFGQLVLGDQHRAETAGAIEVFANRPLRCFALVVAHRNVVEAAVAKHGIQGVFHGRVLGCFANDHGQLGFVVQLL